MQQAVCSTQYHIIHMVPKHVPHKGPSRAVDGRAGPCPRCQKRSHVRNPTEFLGLEVQVPDAFARLMFRVFPLSHDSLDAVLLSGPASLSIQQACNMFGDRVQADAQRSRVRL